MIIYARNVNDAWQQAITLIERCGETEPSRVGMVQVAPFPVTTIYSNPQERVLFDPVRDANPIFHLHEALWMLAGREDATWLDQFVSDFSARFAESDGHMHGAYGYRWRNHFENVNSFHGGPIDQLDRVVGILFDEPSSRQAVIQMWDVESDLGVFKLNDRPCNTQIYLRIHKDRLNMCVTCRSNDIVWGAYGANAVHFSILQEYLAARLRVAIGTLTQFSWNWHMYTNVKHLVDHDAANGWARYPDTIPLVIHPETFNEEVKAYVNDPETSATALNPFFYGTARPMFMANIERKAGNLDSALSWASLITAPDWNRATIAWLERRRK